MGQWDSEKDFAEHIVDECYNLDDMMGSLASYFDYEAYARDLFIDDYYFTDGYVFRR
jgi:antirestriction protein